MKKIKQADLDRLRRKKGVKIIAKKKPGPEKASGAKSGVKPAELPVPALTQILPVMDKMTEVLSKLEARGHPKGSAGVLGVAKKEEEQEKLLTAKIQKAVSSTIAALPKSDNTQTVVYAKRERIPWTHIAHRDRTGHIDNVISTDKNGNSWRHDVVRENKLITEIVSNPS